METQKPSFTFHSEVGVLDLSTVGLVWGEVQYVLSVNKQHTLKSNSIDE